MTLPNHLRTDGTSMLTLVRNIHKLDVVVDHVAPPRPSSAG